MTKIRTDPNFWDCECEHNYIHEKILSPTLMRDSGVCLSCGAHEIEMPDSRVIEIRPENMALNS